MTPNPPADVASLPAKMTSLVTRLRDGDWNMRTSEELAECVADAIMEAIATTEQPGSSVQGEAFARFVENIRWLSKRWKLRDTGDGGEPLSDSDHMRFVGCAAMLDSALENLARDTAPPPVPEVKYDDDGRPYTGNYNYRNDLPHKPLSSPSPLPNAEEGDFDCPKAAASRSCRCGFCVALRQSTPAPEQGEAVELTKCCGREECGGECGNEWRGTEWVRKATQPEPVVEDKTFVAEALAWAIDAADCSSHPMHKAYRMALESLANSEPVRVDDAKDAARYRWLRGEGFDRPATIWVIRFSTKEPIVHTDLDAAIDAALAGKDGAK